MKEVAIWMWGTTQGAAALLFGEAIASGIPLSGPEIPFWMIILWLVNIFGNAAALICLGYKFKKYW